LSFLPKWARPEVALLLSWRQWADWFLWLFAQILK